MTDYEIALGWLKNPPPLPPSDNQIDTVYPNARWLGASLAELVIKWGVSVAEAQEVFNSWVVPEVEEKKPEWELIFEQIFAPED